MWYIILLSIICFIFGYYFAKMRYRVNDCLKMMNIQSRVIKGEISSEEALKEIKKIGI